MFVTANHCTQQFGTDLENEQKKTFETSKINLQVNCFEPYLLNAHQNHPLTFYDNPNTFRNLTD